MEAVCIRECTIPGRGLVEVGVKVNVPDPTAPWLKHFKVQGQPVAAPEPVVAHVAPVAVVEPVVAPVAQARRGGRPKKL
jgi:hypothetical protein